MYQFSDT